MCSFMPLCVQAFGGHSPHAVSSAFCHLLRLVYVDVDPFRSQMLPRLARPFDGTAVDAPIDIPHSAQAEHQLGDVRTFVSGYLLDAAGHVHAWEVRLIVI